MFIYGKSRSFDAGGGLTDTAYVSNNSFDNGGSNVTSHTFSSQNIGTAQADREVHVIIVTAEFTTSPQPSAVSINGETATKSGGTSTTGSGSISHWYATVANDATGDIVITCDMRSVGIAVFVSYNKTVGTPVTASGNTTGSISVDINTSSGDDVLAGGISFDESGTPDFTGVTSDFTNLDIRSNELFCAGHENGVAAATPRTVTYSPSNMTGANQRLALSVTLS